MPQSVDDFTAIFLVSRCIVRVVMNEGEEYLGRGGRAKLINPSYLPLYLCAYVSSLHFVIKHAVIIFSNSFRSPVILALHPRKSGQIANKGFLIYYGTY